MVEHWKHRKSGAGPSESQLERELKRMLAKRYPSSTAELIRVVAESKVKSSRSPGDGSEDRT